MNSLLQVVTFIALIGSITGHLEEAMNRQLNRDGGSASWNYAGQGHYWPEIAPYCGGKRQSPIDIDTSKTFDTTTGSLKFSGYGGDLAGTFTNTGKSLKFTPEATEASDLPGIKDKNGSHIMGSYELLQLHFHWGSDNDRGSEHTIDGNRFAMEMHLVHIKKQYLGDTDAALASPDGLSVVGIMFVVGQNGSDFAPLQPMVDAALEMADDQSAEVDADINLKDFVNEVGPCYYTYYGSLTTPTCNEVVSWFMMDGTIAISQEQLDAFKGLEYDDGAPIVDNFRPPQPLNNRIVKRVVPMDY